MIQVLLADDQRLVREGIRRLLELTPDIRVIIEVADGTAALESLSAAGAEVPDLLLLDVRMPRLGGIEVIEELGRQGKALPSLLLTNFDDETAVLRAIRAGARGLLLKDVSLQELAEGIRVAAAGGSLVLPVISDRISRNEPPPPLAGRSAPGVTLTPREREILRLMANGSSNREIADAFGTSEGTVKNQVSSVLVKLGVRDRTRAVLKALELGVI